jgi:hypothetical protein
MKVFYCDGCASPVFFENVKCLKCGHALGFLPALGDLCALEPAEDGTWRALTFGQSDERYHQCSNGKEYQVCNWMVSVKGPRRFCTSCELNEVIPDLSTPGNVERWYKLEIAKRRIVYTILRLGLPLNGMPGENRPALRFRFIGDTPGGPPVWSGHLNGVITINIAEADDAERERRRVTLREPYRTLVGHLRHEVAHYYWDRLILKSKWHVHFRKLFGDEASDYAAALKKYYDQGVPTDWQSRRVSSYASAHPWEDWAETWAHYFHIVDTVETAATFGVKLEPKHPAASTMTSHPERAARVGSHFDEILENWFPLTHALNSLNRGMGLPDLYPFALSPAVIEKLQFIHQVVQDTRANRSDAATQG